VEAPGPAFTSWYEALEARHLRSLSFAEVRRALQALSSLYVEQRGRRLAGGAALESAGKRAAFALYYGPLHFLLTRCVVRALGAAAAPLPRLADLGCGTGTAGAAWALELPKPATVAGVDRSGWAVEEARWTLARLGLEGRVVRGDLAAAELPPRPCGVVLAYAVNELDDAARERLLRRLLEASARGARVLVLEPLSKRVAPWWPEWAQAFRAAGGRDDEWRFPVALPERLALLARAATLDARTLGGRTLFV
jgi:hypothetical protein